MKTVKLLGATKDYIWGGNKLREYGKTSDKDRIAESWELSFHKDGPSLIVSGENSGRYLKDIVTKEDLGPNCDNFEFFPCLIKLINSQDNLSVQVHPSDEYALRNENSYGKTEMWYILEADKGSGLYVGLKRDSTEEEIKKSLEDSTILDLLNFYEVKPGDCYMIPSGTIHAIGKGVTLIEIQQNSNLTYRLYDYNRKDQNGNPRELHIDKALKVIDYSKYQTGLRDGNILGICKYFSSFVETNEEINVLSNKDSFMSITVISGNGMIDNIVANKGDSFFVPAGQVCVLDGSFDYILTTITK